MFPIDQKTIAICRQIQEHLGENPEALAHFTNALVTGAHLAVAAARKREGKYRTALTCALGLLKGERLKGPTGDAMSRMILDALLVEGAPLCEADKEAGRELMERLR